MKTLVSVLKHVKKPHSPVLLAISAVLVIKVLEALYPDIFSTWATRLFQNVIIVISSAILGYSLGRATKTYKIAAEIVLAILIIILLIILTPHLVDFVPGIILTVIGWIGGIYYLEVGGLKLIKGIKKVNCSKKQILLQVIKVSIELLTFAVAILEFINFFIPILK